jgi:hypothetical protein
MPVRVSMNWRVLRTKRAPCLTRASTATFRAAQFLSLRMDSLEFVVPLGKVRPKKIRRRNYMSFFIAPLAMDLRWAAFASSCACDRGVNRADRMPPPLSSIPVSTRAGIVRILMRGEGWRLTGSTRAARCDGSQRSASATCAALCGCGGSGGACAACTACRRF